MARKRFGQNFLHKQGVINRIISAVNAKPTDTLLEIGPGHGALTLPLLAAGHAVNVIELDRDLVAKLRQQNLANLNIIEGDALRADYAQLAQELGSPLRLIGNLPYNISSPLLFALLGSAAPIQDMHFMLQKEVVDRIVAAPGSKTYGRLSIAIAARAKAVALFDVGPGAFNPPPKVMSSIVRIIPAKPNFTIDNWRHFDQVVTAAFSMRRKTIRNGLKKWLTAEEIQAAGCNPQHRPEQICPALFAQLANAYTAKNRT